MSRFCIISAQHDYRSLRRVNLHFIAQELRRFGQVRFFSLRFSRLTSIRGRDPRLSLSARANRVEEVDGIDCYLWRTPVHPVSLPEPLAALEALTFSAYVAQAPEVLRRWIADSDLVILESGVAIVFLELIRSINPKARILYLAADSLDTIGAAQFARSYLDRVHSDLDGIILPSPALAEDFPRARATMFIPHGINREDYSERRASPFEPGSRNGVSVGSMLFDPRFFDLAAPLFPDIHFHVIGSGTTARRQRKGNVTYYPEMNFTETLAYLQHADFGIAPYRPEEVPSYLADTSMKLMQFGYLGLPAVCPAEAVSSYPRRFGYDIARPESVKAAIAQALTAPHQSVASPSWSEVTDRILAFGQTA